MKRVADFICGLVLVVLSPAVVAAQTVPPCPQAPTYGNDATAGHVAKINGISLYYESYGAGPPLLLIHGNGGSINSTRCQIAYFSRSHRVIVADSRSHGRSGSGEGRLTFEQLADDLSALLLDLRIDASDVWGHSDGGIVALLLAIRHPQQVRAMVASSANLRPDETALTPSFFKNIRAGAQTAADMIKAGDRSRDWMRRKRQLDLMLEEPHIPLSDLRKIAAPTLVIGADADIIPPRSHARNRHQHPWRAAIHHAGRDARNAIRRARVLQHGRGQVPRSPARPSLWADAGAQVRPRSTQHGGIAPRPTARGVSWPR